MDSGEKAAAEKPVEGERPGRAVVPCSVAIPPAVLVALLALGAICFGSRGPVACSGIFVAIAVVIVERDTAARVRRASAALLPLASLAIFVAGFTLVALAAGHNLGGGPEGAWWVLLALPSVAVWIVQAVYRFLKATIGDVRLW